MKYIAQNLRLIREDVIGASREEFADFIGTSASILANYESGRTKPKPMFVQEVAKKCEIDADALANKRLTKTDIPVIVIKSTEPSSEVQQVMEEQKKLIENLQRQVEQQQKVIEVLTSRL